MLKHLPLAILCTLFAADRSFAAADENASVINAKLGKYRAVLSTNCPGHQTAVGKTIKLGVTVASREPGFVLVNRFFNGMPQGEAQLIKFGERADFTLTPEVPGSAALICDILDADRKPVLSSRKVKYVFGIGALAAPEAIRPGNADEPADFDEFWKNKRAELDQIPVKAVRTVEKPDPKHPDILCYDVQVDCAGTAPVSGYLCMPKNAKPKSLPAMVMFHGAGVLSAKKHPEYAAHALVFNINAHGLPNGKHPSFYKKIAATALKTYRVAHLDDHNKVYFVGMFMRVMRALDYVKSLPEWDGKTLIVMGTSQGGGQALAGAALDRRVSLCCANIPALCDLGGAKVGRRPGWPIHLQADRGGWSAPEVISEAAYIDGVFFARRIKCPVYLSTGLIDQTCVPTAVYSVYNSLPGGTEKHIEFNPRGGHGTVSSSKTGVGEIARRIGVPSGKGPLK